MRPGGGRRHRSERLCAFICHWPIERTDCIRASNRGELRSDGSAYQEYVLTEKGRALLPVLDALGQWGADHLFCSGELGFTPVGHRKKKPLKKLDLVSVERKSIKPTEVLFPKTPSFTCKKRNLA